MALQKEEIYRKVLHIFSGSIIPAAILYIPRYSPHFSRLPGWLTPKFYSPVLAAAACALFIGVEALRFRSGFVQRLFFRISGPALRPEESRKLTGATYIALSTLICSIVFIDRPYISFMALCAFIWGDAAAALVGQSIGRIKIGKKSLEGSLGCFALCMVLFIFVFPLVPHLLEPWQGKVPLAMACLASVSITVMELFPIQITKNFVINDNLTVPVFTGIIMQVVYPFIK
jgi:dolichol kinase